MTSQTTHGAGTPRRGRPPGQKYHRRISLRMSDDELAAIEAVRELVAQRRGNRPPISVALRLLLKLGIQTGAEQAAALAPANSDTE